MRSETREETNMRKIEKYGRCKEEKEGLSGGK
jgi:hypothetical protein